METSALTQFSTEELLARYAQNKDARLRDQIIERHDTLVRSLAHKFARPGVPAEDLMQSAWIALINALDRFDPTHQTRFSTYAVHCMVGEIKRYFRDRTWAIKGPRHLQEIAANLGRTEDELYRKYQREPTMAEMAEAFKITEETLAQAMEMHRGYQPQGLDDQHEMPDGGDSMTLGEMLGRPDTAMEAIVDAAPLAAALSELDPRKQEILRRRYFDGCSQQEVADELGYSQMHISRLERAALKELRGALAETYA